MASEKKKAPRAHQFITLDEIEAARDMVYANVYVHEWQKSVRLRSWDGFIRADFDRETDFLSSQLDPDDADQLTTARAIAWSLVDKENRPICPLPKLRDLKKAAEEKRLEQLIKPYRLLAAKSGKALRRVYNVVAELNAIGEEEEVEIEGKF